MADVFISYSRKDAEFAQRLFSHLQKDKHDVWVDWEDIPLTADWWKEITDGIESAQAFVFIMSPDSVSSPICNFEISHALQYSKRIVPILYRDVNEDEAFLKLNTSKLNEGALAILADRELSLVAHESWGALARYNWVNFSNDTNFASTFDQFLTILNTDLDYTKHHTRLLVRALEWDRNNQNKSYLLRGSDLQVAEHWIATKGEKEPQATQIHEQYIFTSRAIERVNQRRLLAGVTSALIVTLFLAIVAMFAFQNAEQERVRADANAATSNFNEKLALTNEADAFAKATIVAQERDRADENARIALSRQLAAQAINLRSEHFDLALLLGMEAYMRHEEPRTQSSALEILGYAPHLQRYLRGHKAPVRAIAISSDDKIIASGDSDGSVILWDVATGQRIGLGIDVTFSVNALSFGQGKNQIIVSTGDGTLTIWDTNTGELIQQVREALPATDLFLGAIEDQAIFTADATRMLTASQGGKVAVWDVSSGSLIDEIQVGTVMNEDIQIDKVAIAPNASVIAVSLFDLGQDERGLNIIVWNLDDGNRHEMHINGLAGMSLAFSPDSSLLTFAERERTERFLRLWDVSSASVKETLSIDFDPVQIVFDQLGKHLFITSLQGDVTVINIETSEVVLPATRGHSSNIQELVVFADGRHFVTGGDDTNLILWDLDPIPPLAQLLAPDASAHAIVFNSDSSLVALANDNSIEIRRVEDGSLFVNPFVVHEETVEAILFHPSKNVLATSSNGQVKLWNIEQDQASLLRTLEHLDSSSLDFSPDGRMLATASFTDGIRIWDVETGDLLNEPELRLGDSLLEGVSSSVIPPVIFSPDGHFLATNHTDAIYIWEIDEKGTVSTKPLRSLKLSSGETIFLWQMQYSPDERLLAASNNDGAIFVWNPETGELALPPLLGHQSTVWELSFDPTSQILASASNTDGLQLFDMSSGDSLGSPLEDGFVSSPDFGQTLVQGGPILASLSKHGPSLWYLNVQSWRESACLRSNLLLSETDWQTYFGEIPYHLSCPESALSQADYLVLIGEQQMAADLMAQAVSSAIEYENASLNDAICRYGSLDLLQEIVLASCDKAIDLDPGNGFYFDSRGIGRAINNDLEGAIEDFTVFIEWSQDNDLYETLGKQREIWIEQLRNGENPFGLETRKALRREFAQASAYKVTIDDGVALLDSELPPPPQAMTPERLAEKIAEADLPYTPIIPSSLIDGSFAWFIDGAGRLDPATMDTNSRKLLAPGNDSFGIRLYPYEGEGFAAIFQSNAPYANLNEWSNDAAGQFSVLKFTAELEETLQIEDVEVRKFIFPDVIRYYFVFNDLQFVIFGDTPAATTDLLESIIVDMFSTKS